MPFAPYAVELHTPADPMMAVQYIFESDKPNKKRPHTIVGDALPLLKAQLSEEIMGEHESPHIRSCHRALGQQVASVILNVNRGRELWSRKHYDHIPNLRKQGWGAPVITEGGLEAAGASVASSVYQKTRLGNLNMYVRAFQIREGLFPNISSFLSSGCCRTSGVGSPFGSGVSFKHIQSVSAGVAFLAGGLCLGMSKGTLSNEPKRDSGKGEQNSEKGQGVIGTVHLTEEPMPEGVWFWGHVINGIGAGYFLLLAKASLRRREFGSTWLGTVGATLFGVFAVFSNVVGNWLLTRLRY